MRPIQVYPKPILMRVSWRGGRRSKKTWYNPSITARGVSASATVLRISGARAAYSASRERVCSFAATRGTPSPTGGSAPAVPDTRPKRTTASMGPMDAMPMSPKLSSSADRSLRTEKIPTPSAMMKGTVICPVVAPPESKARATKTGEILEANKNTTAYPAMMMRRKGIWNTVRARPRTKKRPTPADTQ